MCFVISNLTYSQDVVAWTFEYHSEHEQIQCKAKMKDGWHIYSMDVDETIGPVPTSFEFNENTLVTLKGGVVAPNPTLAYDENFGGELKFYENEVIFIQNVTVDGSTDFSGKVMYMMCNNEMCYPPVEVNFELEINKEGK